MRDYVREMMDRWTVEGDQAAYDLGDVLLRQIDAEFDRLRNQAALINALGAYLQDSGMIETSDSTPSLEPVEASERPRVIIEAAQALWRRLPPGNNLIRVQHVLDEMTIAGFDLGVQQPLAVIGTVLARADGFTKVARNTFEYRTPIDDLPF